MNESDFEKLVERVTNLELLVTHLERNYQQLNEIVTQHSDKLDELSRQTDRLQRQLLEFKSDADDATDVDP